MQMARGGRREGAGRKFAASTIDRVLVRHLERTSGADLAARLSAVMQDPEVPLAVQDQAAAHLAGYLWGVTRYPNTKLLRTRMGEAEHNAA
jgi:hypothetical protein